MQASVLEDRLSELLTTDEVASWLKVSPPTVRRWARDGDIPSLVLAGQWRFSRREILDWLDREAPE